MAVYTQQVDPQSFQSTGYQLPVNQIIQAVATRNAYWDIGASQLKNAQSRFHNLSLTLDKNKQEHANLIKGVDTGLKQAARADLSIAPNVHDAMRVFDPIVKNENIMGDNAITTHYQSQMAYADSLRTKDGGKEYSPTNVKDLMIGLDEFAKSGDPSRWREHYAKRRTYTPYYDVQAEIRELRKTFKPDVKAKTVPGIDPTTGKNNSLYLTTTIDKSSYQKDWKAYLSANLSDRGRQQLAINGRVAFYEREPELAQAYADYTQDQVQSLITQRDVLRGAYTALKKDLSPEADQAYRSQISEMEENIRDLSNEASKLENGDLSSIAANKDQIAALVYSDSYLSNVARSLEVIDMEVTYKPDTAAINNLNQMHADWRLGQTLASREKIAQDQLDMEMLKLKATLKAQELDPKQFLRWEQGLMNSGPDNNKEITLEMYNKQVEQSKLEADKAGTDLLNHFLNHVPDFKGKSVEELNSFLTTWVEGSKDNKNFPLYRTYKTKYDIYHNQVATRNQVVKDAETEARRLYPSAFADNTPNPDVYISGINKNNGRKSVVKIPGAFLKPIAFGTAPNFKLFKINQGKGTADVEIDGVPYDIPTSEYAKISNLIERVNERSGGNAQKINELVNKSLTESLYIQKPDADQYQQFDMKRARQDFAREFGLSEDGLKGTTIYGRNQLGTFYNVDFSDKDKVGVSKSDLKERITQKGGNVYELEGREIYFVPYDAGVGGLNDFYSNPSLRPIQSYFDWKKVGNDSGSFMSPAGVDYEPGTSGESFSFNMVMSDKVPSYYPVHKNTGKIISYQGRGFSSLEEATLYLEENFGTKENFQKYINIF